MPWSIDFFDTFGKRFVTRFVFELTLVIKDRLRKVFPDFIAHGLSRKLTRGFFEIASEFIVSFWPAGEPDDHRGRRQVAVGGEIIQCGTVCDG